MIIYLGADHRGFQLKEKLKDFLKLQGYEFVDLGNNHYEATDDYPDFAAAVAEKVALDSGGSRGILICGSGAGVDIVANKFKNIRSVLGFSVDQVYGSRHDDDANILSLAADFITEEQAWGLVRMFLTTAFVPEGRYQRRLDKISRIENA